jgi:hypothetical protein
MKALLESTDTQYVEGCPVTPVVTEQLWVEKYAPHSFTELLSDEHTNREVNGHSIILRNIFISVDLFCKNFCLNFFTWPTLFRYFYG